MPRDLFTEGPCPYCRASSEVWVCNGVTTTVLPPDPRDKAHECIPMLRVQLMAAERTIERLESLRAQA